MRRIVLIVEDSEPCGETLQIALEVIPDLEVRLMQNPRAAMAAMQENGEKVAAIVTDLHLPQTDGFDFIRQLRSEPRFARLPILLISGDSDPGLPRRALEIGADAFFPKPYSPSAVRRKLEQLLC